MILKVARLGHPVIRTPAQPLDPARITTPEIQNLLDYMVERMPEYPGDARPGTALQTTAGHGARPQGRATRFCRERLPRPRHPARDRPSQGRGLPRPHA